MPIHLLNNVEILVDLKNKEMFDSQAIFLSLGLGTINFGIHI